MVPAGSTTTRDAAAAEAADVEQLDRVLHRLVIADDTKLSAVLDILLPKLVRKLNGCSPRVRGKVIDVLSHISKRVRPSPSIKLPCSGLLAVCKDVPATSFAFNFSLSFLEMGVPRLESATQGKIALQIASGISRLKPYSPSSNILLNLLLVVLEHLPLRAVEEAATTQEESVLATAAAAEVAELAQEDSSVVSDWFLDVCLYPGVLKREESRYNGLSPAGLARLTSKEKEWPADLLTRRKLAVVRALKSDLFSPAAAIVPAVAAAGSSTHHEVLKASEDLLKSLSLSDRYGTLRRDPTVASGLLNLVLGGAPAAGGSNGDGASRSPASAALAVRALAWLEAECPEGTAARVPEAVKVLFLALFTGDGPAAGTERAPGAPHHDRANAARFRAAGARLAAFVAARCNIAILPMVGPLLLQAVQRVLVMNAAPSSLSTASGSNEAPAPVGATLLMQIQQRAMLEACYEAVASLAVRRPELFAGDISVPRLLFLELSAKEPSLRVKISAALGALKGAYRTVSGDHLKSELWSLLWGASVSPDYRARLCAVEWACDLFDFSDVAARRLCISLCDDTVTAVRSAASRGLHPPRTSTSYAVAIESVTSTDVAAGASAGARPSRHPTFKAFVLGAMVDSAVPSSLARLGGTTPPSLKELPPAVLARAVDFALECHKAHGSSDADSTRMKVVASEGDDVDNTEEAVAVFLAVLETTLASAPSATDGQHGHAQMVLLHRSAAVALQKLAAGDVADESGTMFLQHETVVASSAPVAGVAARLASRGPWLQQWLGHEGSTEIREAFAETTGAAAEFMNPNTELVPLLRALGHKLKPCTMPGAAGFTNRAVSSAHGAACALGSILARLAAANRTASGNPDGGSASPGSRSWVTLFGDALPAALSSVAAAVGHPVSLLHIAACGAIGRVGAAGPLPVRPAAAVAVPPSVHGGDGEGDNIVTSTASTTVQVVFERLWGACKLGETTDASRRTEAAAEALGRCCRGGGGGVVSGSADSGGSAGKEEASARLRKTLLVLFDMAKNQKQEELQFAVGAAVADLACSGLLRVPPGKTLEGLRSSALSARREVKEESEGDTGDGGAFIDALDYVLYQVLYVLLEDHSPHVSGAAAVYLLAVVQRCRGHPVLAAYLPDVQAAFTRKLTVRSEFVQEVAGKGLALVYQAAGSESKKGLVESLAEALSTGRRRAAALGAATGTGGGGVDVHGATHAGAALSEAGAGAYGEMCAIANDVGRPDLIYSFLSMASHHAAWTTRRGASFGLGAIINQVSADAFGGQLARIVPRLFRYRFDPSAKTRAAMDQLWRAIVGGGSGGDFSVREKEVIHSNLSAIVTELLRALGDRNWRDRQSACAGLSDVLRGRTWDEIGPHLEMLWTMADRGLDDIKESVAEAAVDYAKTVASISVRLCDPYSFAPSSGGDAERGTAAAAAAAARDDAAGNSPDSMREEADEARRTIGTMFDDLRASEAEARARGEEDLVGAVGGGLGSTEGRNAATDEVLRQALERGQRQGGGGEGAVDAGGVGRVLGGGRDGPTVDEILRPGRAGAERNGPPPTEAAKAAAAGAVGVTLPWLLRKGILSRCKPSQALAMRTIQRLVKVCDKEALVPHLAELVATLIEGLSALEPQALQYMQFHAETQLEMSQDQMERLRLSVSRAGPLQDALDNCYRHLDHAGVVEALMPRLLGLLRSGTGLATRSASAYLVLSLCERAPMEIYRAAPRLLTTLTNTALSERSSTLRRTYSSALSSVARLAPAAGVSRLASRLAQLFREADPDFDKRQRRTLALLLGDLCRRAGGQLGAPGTSVRAAAGEGRGEGPCGVSENGGSGFASSGWNQILPVAFVASSDPDKPVAEAFKEAWQEGLTQLQLGAAGQGEACRVRSVKDAVVMMLPAILAEVSQAISSVSRVTKRQGCSGLKRLASILGSSLGEESSGRRLIRRVLSQIPGRTWEGKEELLEAVVALCSAGKGSAIRLEPFVWGGQEESGGGSVEGGWGGVEGELSSSVSAAYSSSSLRGVKRTRSSEPLVDEDEEEGGKHAEERVSSVAKQEVIAGATVTPALAVAKTNSGSVDGLASDENDETSNSNEDSLAFEYEDRVGDLDNGATGSAAPEEITQARKGDQPRKDAALEAGLASLDVEDDSPTPFGDVVVLMLSQLLRKDIKFRRAAASSLAALLDAFPECCVYELVAPTLLYLAGLDTARTSLRTGGTGGSGNGKGDGKEDPIMQARAVACLAAAWPRVPASPPSGASTAARGAEGSQADVHLDAVCDVQRVHAASLTRALSGAVLFKVWSIRVQIYGALLAIVSRTTTVESRTPVLTGSLLAEVVQAVEVGAEDAKYSQVRAAAVSVVGAMTSRKELRLALTPHKEGLAGAARRAAEDLEPKVAMEGSKAAQNLSWWP